MSQRYAVIDIETTGGHFKTDKITEIGIVILEDAVIIEKYSSLVNPERSIPPHITRITGITNDMVMNAPKFYEIAKDIIKYTKDTIFVAHNVRFDYQFLQAEFKSLGYTFSKRKLCTVQLSRKNLPGLKSYSLGNLINHFNIEVKSRHRALDDAYAASVVLVKVLEQAKTKKEQKTLISESIKITNLPKNLDLGVVESLPECCGVYYFKDLSGQIVYIGKSINIQKRIKQHFGKEGKKGNRLFREVAEIDFVETGSELLSLLLESDEIKKKRPLINVAQKQTNYPFTIIFTKSENDYHSFEVHKVGGFLTPNQEMLGKYTSARSAKSRLKGIVEMYELCLQYCDIEKRDLTSCFNYEVKKCEGACLNIESFQQYNLRAEQALLHLQNHLENRFIIIEEGVGLNERVCFVIKDSMYCGYTIIDAESQKSYFDIEDEVQFQVSSNAEHQRIIQSYVMSHPSLTIMTPS